MDDTGNGDSDKIRKTVSFSHRQLGIGSSVVAAMLFLNPVKQWFFTREEGSAQSKEITELKRVQEDNFKELKSFIIVSQDDQLHKLERLNDKVVEQIKDSEVRAQENDARQEKRIDMLEEAALINGRTKKTN